MKLRGTLGGLNLLIESEDTAGSVADTLSARPDLLQTSVTLELAGDTDPLALEAALAAVRAAGGTVTRVRTPKATIPTQVRVSAPPPEDPRAQDDTRTVILQHGLRAGFRGEYRGSVVVLGDVNPGAELIAGGDVIVMGALRGVVHAGADGRQDAIVYARPIASAQIRIADALARAPESSSMDSMKRREASPEAELARLQDGSIQIEAYHPQRS
ncbi:septum site-determining protein MinC [Deinococcus sonorensis]|uniref:Probable septum site-determining protein MinC n=2 Tax=Deinococcus sonorensis TaxID=309891 RepID=A0AAU7U9M1_9DEIO